MDTFVGAEYVIANALIALSKKGMIASRSINFERLECKFNSTVMNKGLMQ